MNREVKNMKHFIPYEKLSKRERRARDAQRRGDWGMSPVTRRPEKPGAYNRAKTRNRDRKDLGFASSLFSQDGRILLFATFLPGNR